MLLVGSMASPEGEEEKSREREYSRSSQSEDIFEECSEFEKMKQGKLLHGFPTWKQQTYATRIMKMNLSPLERDTLAFTIRQFKRYGNEGNVWHRRGNFLFAVQMVAAAVVPVLIGLLGSFDSDFVDLAIRLIAITLSVTGTFCNVVESVYQFRERGQRRKTFADRVSGCPVAVLLTPSHRLCSPCPCAM